MIYIYIYIYIHTHTHTHTVRSHVVAIASSSLCHSKCASCLCDITPGSKTSGRGLNLHCQAQQLLLHSKAKVIQPNNDMSWLVITTATSRRAACERTRRIMLPGNKGTMSGIAQSARKGTVGGGAAGGRAVSMATAVCSAAFSVMRAMDRSSGKEVGGGCSGKEVGGGWGAEDAGAACVGVAF